MLFCTVNCISVQSQDKTSDDEILKMLNSFYTSYITERSKMPEDEKKVELIKSKYFTANLLDKLDKLNKQGLNYDPFINAQDWDIDLLKKLMIRKEIKSNNIFEVSYPDNYRKTLTKIKLIVIKQNDNYKIDDIL